MGNQSAPSSAGRWIRQQSALGSITKPVGLVEPLSFRQADEKNGDDDEEDPEEDCRPPLYCCVLTGDRYGKGTEKSHRGSLRAIPHIIIPDFWLTSSPGAKRAGPLREPFRSICEPGRWPNPGGGGGR